MIFARNSGWMCNNILQYGHIYAWGREHGRTTMSMRFAYKFQYFHICHTKWHNFFLYVVAKAAAAMKLIPVVSYNTPNEVSPEKEAIMLNSRHVVVQGWEVRFYDLFEKYKDEIIRLFAFDKRIERSVDAVVSKMNCDLLLGVHIRRGDYKTFYGGRYFYDDDVFLNYIKTFVRMHSDKHIGIIICGNYGKIDKERYERELSDCKVLFPAGSPPEDLCILSKCDWLIGPPSTFSLTASMYHDIPLCWMHTADASCIEKPEAWGKFNKLFREII